MNRIEKLLKKAEFKRINNMNFSTELAEIVKYFAYDERTTETEEHVRESFEDEFQNYRKKATAFIDKYRSAIESNVINEELMEEIRDINCIGIILSHITEVCDEEPDSIDFVKRTSDELSATIFADDDLFESDEFINLKVLDKWSETIDFVGNGNRYLEAVMLLNLESSLIEMYIELSLKEEGELP